MIVNYKHFKIFIYLLKNLSQDKAMCLIQSNNCKKNKEGSIKNSKRSIEINHKKSMNKNKLNKKKMIMLIKKIWG